MEIILNNFFWEGNKGSKMNHLVKGDLVKQLQEYGGLGFGDFFGSLSQMRLAVFK